MGIPEPKQFVIQYLIRQYLWAVYICMDVYLIRKYIYLEEYDLDIFKIYLWCICFIFFGGVLVDFSVFGMNLTITKVIPEGNQKCPKSKLSLFYKSKSRKLDWLVRKFLITWWNWFQDSGSEWYQDRSISRDHLHPFEPSTLDMT